jgi:hypothetical protein
MVYLPVGKAKGRDFTILFACGATDAAASGKLQRGPKSLILCGGRKARHNTHFS